MEYGPRSLCVCKLSRNVRDQELRAAVGVFNFFLSRQEFSAISADRTSLKSLFLLGTNTLGAHACTGMQFDTQKSLFF